MDSVIISPPQPTASGPVVHRGVSIRGGEVERSARLSTRERGDNGDADGRPALAIDLSSAMEDFENVHVSVDHKHPTSSGGELKIKETKFSSDFNFGLAGENNFWFR